MSLALASEMTWISFFQSSRSGACKPNLLVFGCREKVQGGSGVPEVLRAFGATLAGNLGVVSPVSKSYFQSPRRVRREIGGGHDRLRILGLD
jgi:hypothetical protein